jgi:hypothetical protein
MINHKLASEAKMKIQDEIQAGRLGLVWSYILEAENKANPFEEKKKLSRVGKIML